MAEILLLEPDRIRAQGIRSILRVDGHQVHLHRTLEDWKAAERNLRPELVVTAADAIDPIFAPASTGRGFPAPVLWIQEAPSEADPFVEHRLIDRIASPFMDEELLARIDALVRVRRVIYRQPVPPLGTDARRRRELKNPNRPRRGLFARMTAFMGARKIPREIPLGPYLEVAARVAEWSDRRDAFEPGHAERVATLCSMITETLSMESDETYLLLAAAMLHDIGKATLPLELLHQQTPLEENQTQRIRSHPRRGADILRALDPQKELAETILLHHERPDGNGYYGKAMEEVPRAARALAVAEVYDAMVSSRYKSVLSRDDALRELGEIKGRSLDSDCVEALVSKLQRRATVIPVWAPELPPARAR